MFRAPDGLSCPLPFQETRQLCKQVNEQTGMERHTDTNGHTHPHIQPDVHILSHPLINSQTQSQKWMLVNLQDHENFASHRLNRDVW